VQLSGSASAVFAYATGELCQADTFPSPVQLGTPGGIFSSATGLQIDSLTGQINLLASPTGAHSATYTLSGNCQATFTLSLTLLPSDSTTSITFPDSIYCTDGSDPRPLITGDTIGNFLPSPGMILANTDQGIPDLSAMQPGGPYNLTFDIRNRCATDPVASFHIAAQDDPAFSYPEIEWCQGGINPAPDQIAQPGTFSEPTNTVTFADSLQGIINATATPPGGPYLITHTTLGHCPATATVPIIILPAPQNTALVLDPGTTICEGHPYSATAEGTGATTWSFYLNRDSLHSTFNQCAILASQRSQQDTLQAILSTPAGCTDTLQAVITAIPAPVVPILDSTATTSPTGMALFSIQVDADIPGTLLTSANPAQLPAPQQIPATVTLDTMPPQPLTPFTLTFTLTLSSLEGCVTHRTVRLTALGTEGIFIPEVFTPDGDGHNDRWFITWQPHIDPNAYTLRLFNGAGGQVWMTNTLEDQFDGGTLPDGVYWWSLKNASGKLEQSGGLTIRRK
jgi:hypothetical protein